MHNYTRRSVGDMRVSYQSVYYLPSHTHACCTRSRRSVGDMSVYFQMLDSLLASEHLPPEYAGRMQQILCNDCTRTGFARWHFAYHACPHCRSYNTRVI